MGHVPDDPFWPPPPDELEEVIVGEHPYILIQFVQGELPRQGSQAPYAVEVHVGGGLRLSEAHFLLQRVAEAVTVEDMAIMPDGTLVRRTDAPPHGPLSPG
jgi:hypothetical protein